MASRPLVSVHYPRSMGEFQSWFATDADCLDYLAWLRWPGGFVCPTCGHPAGWSLADGRIMCKACSSRVSPTSGTIFDRTRTPLTVWFMVCWLFATQKDGTSALTLQKNLEIGSYQTAWALLHRLRSVLVRPGRERLVGGVEVDETYVGGNELASIWAGRRARSRWLASRWSELGRGPRGAAEWLSFATHPPNPCGHSCGITSKKARLWSATAGGLTRGRLQGSMSTDPWLATGRPGPSCCPGCIE